MATLPIPVTFSPEAVRLIALSRNGDQEQLFSLLQNEDMIRTALSSETINPGLNSRFKYFILERMVEAAAGGGHVDLLFALLAFGAQQGVGVPYMVTKNVLLAALIHHQKPNLLELLLVLERVQPDIWTMRTYHGHHILETVCGMGLEKSKRAMPLLRHMMKMGFNPKLTGLNNMKCGPVLLH